MKGALVGQVCEGRGVTLNDDRGGDAWQTVREADIPCAGIQRQLEDFWEGKLKVLLVLDLVREWMIGSCTVSG